MFPLKFKIYDTLRHTLKANYKGVTKSNFLLH